MSAPEPALVLRDVAVAVPDGPETRSILHGVALDLAPGEVVGLTGASGSGKSTLLAVSGLLRGPDRGTVVVAGTDTHDLSGRVLARLRREQIGFVFQSASLFPSLTAIEQLELVAHLGGRLDRGARQRASALIEAVGLRHRGDARPAELSGGERQRVGIARALMGEPAVVLADEPTAALDDRRGREVLEILAAEASARGAAALVVTHNPAQLPPDTRRLHLVDGIVVEEAPAGV